MDVTNVNQLNHNIKAPQPAVRLAGENEPVQYQIGEHVTAFWVEGNETK